LEWTWKRRTPRGCGPDVPILLSTSRSGIMPIAKGHGDPLTHQPSARAPNTFSPPPTRIRSPASHQRYVFLPKGDRGLAGGRKAGILGARPTDFCLPRSRTIAWKACPIGMDRHHRPDRQAGNSTKKPRTYWRQILSILNEAGLDKKILDRRVSRRITTLPGVNPSIFQATQQIKPRSGLTVAVGVEFIRAPRISGT